MAWNFWSPAAHAILMLLAGWIHREQEAVVAYQKEEIRALREMLGGKRPRFSDAQRRRLALKVRPLSHAKLRELGSLVTPDTLTRWFRKYAGAKHDSHAKRGPGRPPKPQHIRDLVLCQKPADPKRKRFRRIRGGQYRGPRSTSGIRTGVCLGR